MVDKKAVEQARTTDMLAFFEKRLGFTFTRQSSTYRCRQHPSLAVKDDRLSWYWHSQGVGGHGAIDYLMKVERLPFSQAVEAVANTPAAVPASRELVPGRELILPEKAGIPLRLYDYLCQKRGIDSQIVGALMRKGQLYEDRRRNVVFVGFDEHGQARFASLRGTCGDGAFRVDCAGSDKQYGFSMTACGSSERLYVFESPIDAMSHASLENITADDQDAWMRDNRLSLAGISDTALPQYLKTHPHIRELVLCLDNDEAGREAAVAIARKYTGLGYIARLELPQCKDYNEDLTALRTRIRQMKSKQKLLCQDARQKHFHADR